MKTTQLFMLCLGIFIVTPAYAQDKTFHDDKLDSYGNISFTDEKKRLDYLAKVLREEPDSVAYINAYAGRKSCVGEAKARALRAKRYLVRRWDIPDNRIIWRDGGYNEILVVDLWVRPRGAPEPHPFATLDPSEVQITGRCNAKSRNRRIGIKLKPRLTTHSTGARIVLLSSLSSPMWLERCSLAPG